MMLKATPTVTDDGSFNITLNCSQSEGFINAFGWQKEESPEGSTCKYLGGSSRREKNKSKAIKLGDIKASVNKPGNYTFRLTVYDGQGNEDFSTVLVEIKSPE